MEYRCRQLFHYVGGLKSKSMLEVGGGEGLFSFWALANGVEKVILLEPEADGVTEGVGKRFVNHKKALSIPSEQLMFFPLTLQEYEGERETFDLVLSYNSINHLDEPACINLHKSETARSKYQKYFEKIYGLMRPAGHFIVSDAGRINFWNQLGVTSTFAPTIEWEKHQEPSLWRQLLNDAGFSLVSLDRLRFYPLRRLGLFGSSRLISRVTTSQFILTMIKS
jgi:SAM-dependent methyltransferase